MNIKIIIVVGLLLLGIVFGFWDNISPPPENSGDPNNFSTISQKETAPDIEFTSLDGKSYKLHKLRGKTVILNFWATWCAPCIQEFPSLITLAHERKENLILLAISADENSVNINKYLKLLPESVKSYLSQDNIIITHDKDKKISADIFQTSTYPETFIISPDMTIFHKIIGPANWSGEEMNLLINEAGKSQ